MANTTVVELLDRSRAALRISGPTTLTFPDVLAGADSTPVSEVAAGRMGEQDVTTVLPGKVTGPVIQVRDIRRGELALQMALKQMGQGKLVGRVVTAEAQHVTIAGFTSLEDAQSYLEALKTQYADLTHPFILVLSNWKLGCIVSTRSGVSPHRHIHLGCVHGVVGEYHICKFPLLEDSNRKHGPH